MNTLPSKRNRVPAIGNFEKGDEQTPGVIIETVQSRSQS